MKHAYKTLLYLILIASVIGCKNRLKSSPPAYKDITKGTLLIAGIAEDGIVLASDSRLTTFRLFSDGTIIPVAYKDSCQKIFIMHESPIAIAGRFSFDTKSMRSLIDSFEATSKVSKNWTDRDLTCVMFMSSFSHYFPPEKYPGNSVLISGGYIKGIPNIRKDFIEVRSVSSYITRSNRPVFSDQRAKSIYLNHVKDTTKLLKSKTLAKIFEKTIKEFSNNFNTVGGPVSILKISKDNSISFMKNDFSDNPLGEKDQHLIPIKDSAIWNRQLRVFNQ